MNYRYFERLALVVLILAAPTIPHWPDTFASGIGAIVLVGIGTLYMNMPENKP